MPTLPETMTHISSPRTLVLIEDEANLRNGLSFILQQQGFAVHAAATGEQGVQLALLHRPDLVLVDIGLPGIDGFDVASQLSQLRRERHMVIVFLTGSDDEADMVRALAGLADDYVVKPLRPRVLMARIHTLLDRIAPLSDDLADAICYGPLRIKPAAVEVYLDEELLSLTPTEFRILLLLAQNIGTALSRTQIIKCVHGADCHLTEKSVDFQIQGLRRKLGVHVDMLCTVRGVGFKLKVL